ncbi:MAG: hypothetical protein IIA82_08180 [Thaumarchaeota archaeon]|nr:hypothetical protein [Nitrososphaerota archaeon]
MVYVEIIIGVVSVLMLIIVYNGIKNSINHLISISYSCTGCGENMTKLKCSNCYDNSNS